MASWLLLLLAQTTLMATGRSAQHKKLGLIAVVLLPLLVFAMIGVVEEVWSLIASLPPGAMTPDALNALKRDISNTLLEQIRIVRLMGFALVVSDRAEAHGRTELVRPPRTGARRAPVGHGLFAN